MHSELGVSSLRRVSLPTFSHCNSVSQYNTAAGRGLPPFSRLATGRAEQSAWPYFLRNKSGAWFDHAPDFNSSNALNRRSTGQMIVQHATFPKSAQLMKTSRT